MTRACCDHGSQWFEEILCPQKIVNISRAAYSRADPNQLYFVYTPLDFRVPREAAIARGVRASRLLGLRDIMVCTQL